MNFAEATAVWKLSGSAPDAGLFGGRIHPDWDIGGNANGGYLLSILGRAMTDALGRPDPVSLTAHFLAPGTPSDVTAAVATIREGRRFATASATLGNERTLMAAIGTFGDLSQADGPRIHDGGPPDLPPESECAGMIIGPEGGSPNFANKLNLRFHPDDIGFMRGEPSDTARLRGWISLNDDEPIDSIALLCIVDAAPPPVFNLKIPLGWVPTLELTAHIRAIPRPGPLRCEFRTRYVGGGFLEEDGLVWDSANQLVAQSRQLALVPRA